MGAGRDIEKLCAAICGHNMAGRAFLLRERQTQAMIQIYRYPGVTEWRFTSFGSRLAGYMARAFLTDDGVLIDTGIPACGTALESMLDASGVRGAIITHHHEDHAGNVERLARRGVPLWIAPDTLPRLTSVKRIGAYRRLTWRSMPRLQSAVMPFDTGDLRTLPSPGHCADHHAVWHAPSRTLFSGDLFLGVAVRIAHHREDPWAMIDSLERMADLEPARMFCAHRGLVPEPVGALRAKAAWIRRTIDELERQIAAGRSDDAILRAVLGGESLAGWASAGEYSRRNFVRLVRERQASRPA